MKFLDIFSGIGGFRIGMEMAGHECVGHVEWDKFAQASYMAMHNVKESEYIGWDIREVRATELPRADIWCFGFPCQDISVAGKQTGFSGHRSSLFFTVTKLIRELKEENRPSILFIENVKNLLSVNGGWDFTKLLIELDEIGYNATWKVLNSKEYGVAQNRERCFIIATLKEDAVYDFGIHEPVITRLVDFLEDEVDEKYYISDDKANKLLNSNFNQEKTRIQSNDTCECLLARDYKDLKCIKIGIDKSYNDTNTINIANCITTREDRGISNHKSEGTAILQIGNIVDTGNWDNPQRGRIYSVDGISPALNCCGGGGLEPKVAVPVLTPDILEKRQNGRRFKEDGEEMFTLTGRDRHGVAIIDDMYKNREQREYEDCSPTLRADRQGLKVNNGYKIRKLTPRECFRLQGFSDEYFERAAKVNSDSQLYKQAGNSVTVNVIYEIAKRLGGD